MLAGSLICLGILVSLVPIVNYAEKAYKSAQDCSRKIHKINTLVEKKKHKSIKNDSKQNDKTEKIETKKHQEESKPAEKINHTEKIEEDIYNKMGSENNV